MYSKSALAIELSKLKTFNKHNFKLEQHETPSEIAANFLWQIHFEEDKIKDKTILDLGCGGGLLGIGALLLGANKVTFIDIDEDVLENLKKNLEYIENEAEFEGNYEIIHADIKNEPEIDNQDITITNPPFGTKNKGIDKEFIKYGLKHSNIVFSFHKTSTIEHLIKWARDMNTIATRISNYNFELWATQSHHKRKIHRIEVSTIKYEKITK